MSTRLHLFFSEHRTLLILAALLSLLTGLLFWPAVHYNLVNLDDIAYISENQMIQNGLTLDSLRQAITSIYQVMWAPGLWISFMLDIDLFGPTTWGMHLTNILLHVANALLAFTLFWRWTRKPWRAFWAAAIWACHPLRVESVAWISARKDVLSGLFFLACLLFYDLAFRRPANPSSVDLVSTDAPPPLPPDHRIRPQPQAIWKWASVAAMALGLTVKPMLVTTPVVLLLLDLWPLGRVRLNLRDGLRKGPRLIAEKWPFWLLAAASAFMAVYAHAQGTSFGSVPLLDRIRTIPLNYAFYLLKTVWPQHLTVLYPGLLFHPLDILVALFYLLIPTLLVWQYRRYSLAPLIGWLWFLAVMLPTSGLIHFGVQSLADRFTYLPALGLSILVLPLFSIRRPLVRGVRLAVCTGILMGLALLTHRQLPVWRDTNHLFSHLLRFSPNHAFALANQAGHLRQEGRLQEAEDRMARACESPAHGDIHQIVYAEMMASQGKTQQARDQLLSINLLSPGSFSGLYHFTFAIVLNQLDDFPEAAREARLAADTLSPYDLIRHDLNLLGMVIAFRMGDPESALEWAHQLPHLQNRTQIGLDDLLPYYVGQWKRFQRIEAVDYFRDYLSRNPSQVEALNNLAWLMATSEWSPIPADEIVGYARRASAQGPSNPILLDTLGVALAHAGDFEAALEAAGQARDIVRAAGQEPSDLSKAIARHINAYQRQTPWLDDKAADRIGSSFYAP